MWHLQREYRLYNKLHETFPVGLSPWPFGIPLVPKRPQMATAYICTSPKDKTRAILDAPEPKNIQELGSFLGLINYYAKFISNFASLLHPLNELLRKDHKWQWTKQCSDVFVEAKKRLASAPVLAHYDPTLPIILAGDASAYGVGAVISHSYPDGLKGL